ncbi:MAG TPA: HNH endonuclease [Nitrospiraceae bacterium]|nr:HNH endonuclease [Nitrospiraceae bacterium]
MPCSARKARLLLRQGKAEVITRTPLRIRLLCATGETVQSVTLGVDSGYEHIGLSAVTKSKEVYTADMQLRTDIVALNSERRQYRRCRRYRKTWYRPARFDNRRKPEVWLPPSIQHKLDSHVKGVESIHSLLPITDVVVEVAAFDIRKIKDPSIEGTGYQQGEQYGYANVREYVLYRDGHTCRHCKGKSKDPVLEVHHLESRKTGGNGPGNLVTVCLACHGKVTEGKVELDMKPSRGFKAETFMSTVRWMLIDRLRKRGFTVAPTYGHITKVNRAKLGLPKSHVNDAFVIAGGNGQLRSATHYMLKQVRKCNRKLFKGDRSHIRNTAPRLIRGFQRYDKVLYDGVECFIIGRRTTGYFDLRTLDGTKVHASAKASSIRLLERASTLLIERRLALLPALTDGVSAPTIR